MASVSTWGRWVAVIVLCLAHATATRAKPHYVEGHSYKAHGYYGPWYSKQGYYKYNYYYKADSGQRNYSYHYCYYYPRDRYGHRGYCYYMNARGQYWGRCKAGSDNYEILEGDDRKPNLDDIKDDTFRPMGRMPKVPGMTPATLMIPPPDLPEQPEPPDKGDREDN